MNKKASLPRLDWRNSRWLIALIGLILLIIGQLQLASDILPDKPATRLGMWLNDVIHLSIPTIDNVVRGLPLLVIGAILLFLSLRGLKLLPAEHNWENDTPFYLRGLRKTWPWPAIGTVVFLLLLWQVRTLEYRPAMAIQWVAAILLFAIMAGIWDHQRKANNSPGLARIDLLWMLGLFILSILVGAYHLQGLPDMLIGDEGSFWTAAREIALGKHTPSIFANGVYTFPVMSSIGQAFMLRVFGLDLWGWRFSSVAAGALAVFPVYLLGRDAFNRKIAIVSGLALAFSPYFLAFSRLGYNNIQSLFITALALYWLYLGFQRSSILYTFLAGCAAGLGFYTYFAARMAIVIAVLFLVLLWIGRKLKFRQAALFLAILLLGAILVIGPYIVHGIRYDPQGMSFKVFESVFFNTFNGLLFYSDEELTAVKPLFIMGGNELFYNPRIYLELIARGLIRTLLIFQKPWLISEHFIASPLTGTVGVIFYLIGLGAIFKRIREPRNMLLVLWFLVTIFGLSTLNTVPPRHTHMVSILPALAILTGMGLHILSKAFVSIHPGLGKWQPVLLGILAAGVAVGGIYDYFILMPRRYHPQPDQIISWASLYAKDEEFIYVYSDPAELDIVRPYLITEFRPQVAYSTVSWEDFTGNLTELTAGSKVVVYYMPSMADGIEPLLLSQWGVDTITHDFYSPNGIPVLAAGMNTPFVFERDRTSRDVLRESYLRSPMLVLLAILLALLGLCAWLPAAWMQRLPRRLRVISTWFSAPALSQDEELDEPVETIDGVEMIASKENIPDEPPAWVEEVFLPTPQRPPGKMAVESRSVKVEQDRDIYIHIHFPALHLPWKSLPEGMRISLPDLDIPMFLLLSGVIVLAVVAQVLVSYQNFIAGAGLYGLSAVGLVFWAVKNRKWRNVLPNQVRIPPRAEVLLGLILLATVIFTRFYDLGYRVYGLEADETKWTAQSWLSTILMVDQGEFAGMHYQFLPVDFWVRSIFLRVFGLDFLSARIESALFSVIAVFFLYLLIRRLTASPPTALLGATIYAFSFMELNASHQALHNTTLEPWLMAGLYYLLIGLQEKKRWPFQASGILLALGMMTYETFFPTVGIALVFTLGMAIRQVHRKQASPAQWLQRYLLLLWPIVVVYLGFTQRYLQARHGYHFGWMEMYSQNGTNWGGAFTFIMTNFGDLLRTIFSSVVWQDSLLRWGGSLLNQLLLPFVVVGLIFNLCNLHRPYLLFIPLWFLFNVASAPLLLGSVWPRVLYTGLAPLTIWGAMGLWVFLAALRPWLSQLRIKAALPAFLLLLLVILANDYRIFTGGIDDPLDRVKRRELADLTALAAARSDLLLYPYLPAQNDTVELETHVLLFTIAGERQTGLDSGNYFQQVPYDQLLPLLWENRILTRLDVIHDKTLLSMQDQRDEYLEIMLHCYPAANLQTSGEFFDIYHFDANALANPECYQSATPVALQPPTEARLTSGSRIQFAWDSGDVETSAHSITIEQQNSEVYWIEAEDVFQTMGWYASSEFTTGFTGNGFLLDNWDSGEAQYTLDMEDGGDFRIWVRTFKRMINDQQNYITVNGKAFPIAGNENPLDQWQWESIGTLTIPGGELNIGMGRTYGQDDMFSVFIDSLFISRDPKAIPDLSNVWQQVYTSGALSGAQEQHILEESLPPGNYRWIVRVFDGLRLIDSDGALGNASTYATFTILP